MHSSMRESEWNHYTGIHRTLHESIKFSSHQMMSLWPWIVTDSKSKSVLLLIGSDKNRKASVKRLQHFNPTYSQHFSPSICQPRPNDRNIWTRHIATLFGATIARVWPSCSKLHEPGQTTITSCKIHKCGIKIWAIFKFEPTAPNMS